MVLVKFRVISNAINFRQTIQRIFNFTYILAVHFCRQNLETLDISHAFLPLTVAKLSTVKKSPVFGSSCLSANHLALAALASQPLKSGTLSLYLSVPVPVLTPSIVISRPTTATTTV